MADNDRYYKNWGPKKRHLVRGTGGVQAEVSDLRGDVEGALVKVALEVGEAEAESAALVGSLEASLEAQIADVSDAATAAINAEAAVLDQKIGKEINETRSEAAAEVLAAASELEARVDDSQSAVEAYVDSEVKSLNDRIGAQSTLLTTDATPTVLATVTPSARVTARIFAKVAAIRDNHYEAAIYSVLAMAKAVPSEETLTLTGNVSNGDQVEIDGVTYTFETVLTPGGTNNVLIGGATAGSITNLINAINDTGVPDTDYGSGTVRHPTFTAAQGAGTTMIAIARLPGTAANGSSVTDPVDTGTVMNWGAATTSGGTDMSLPYSAVTAEHEDDATWNVTIAANGADVEISATGAAGKNIRWVCEVELVEALTWV